METPEERLARLFRGLDRAHGVSVRTSQRDETGKARARYSTKRLGITTDDWRTHLTTGACLVPIPITDRGTVYWGGIDIDIPNMDHVSLVRKVTEAGLPLVVSRTKSGGAHCTLFLEEERDAREVQETLSNWAIALGYGRSEIFPKQVALAGNLDMGNGLAAPYVGALGDTNYLEYALGPDGAAMTLDQFLDYAERITVKGDAALPQIAADALDDPDADIFKKGPPCLERQAREGIPSGERNTSMMNFGILAKMACGPEWQRKLEEWNQRLCDPPLPSGEIQSVIKSLSKSKDYSFLSKCEGPFCAPSLCRKREFGRGGGFDDPGVVLDGLTVINTDPATFILTANGVRITMTSSQFDSQREVRLLVLDKLRLSMKPIKPAVWARMKEKLLAERTEEDAPPDAGPGGQLMAHMNRFFSQYSSNDKEKISLGNAFTDYAKGRVYFRSEDLLGYLGVNRVRGYTARDIYNFVRQEGGGEDRLWIRGKSKRLWWIPADKTEIEDDSRPSPPSAGGEEGKGNVVPF